VLEGGVCMRVNMTLNDELLQRIDSYAKANYMNRSSVVSFACNQFLMANELQSLLIDMKRAMQKIAENGVCTDDQMKELEKFSALCELVTKQGAEN
jgi:metal-responsive CopG/Arc/MetJ family transcriptional regulator